MLRWWYIHLLEPYFYVEMVHTFISTILLSAKLRGSLSVCTVITKDCLHVYPVSVEGSP
jgi:hypothetical protein